MKKFSDLEIEEFMKKINFKKGGELLPIIVQDESTSQVLMQAFMDKQALQLTLATGRMHFWSRSRQKIWCKGEESGHFSLVQKVFLDCDQDALLFQVQQIGAICHSGQETCFYTPITPDQIMKKTIVDAKILEKLFEVLKDRIQNPSKKSYATQLSAKGDDAILRKISEESIELVLATKDNQAQEIISEVTDTIFHILVLLAHKGLNLQDVFIELEKRHQSKTK